MAIKMMIKPIQSRPCFTISSLLAVCLGMLLTGCGDAPPAAKNLLSKGIWGVSWFGPVDKPLSLADDTSITMQFDQDLGQLSVKSGCLKYDGNYELTAPKGIRISGVENSSPDDCGADITIREQLQNVTEMLQTLTQVETLPSNEVLLEHEGVGIRLDPSWE